jgi:uncharacterized protein (DUF2267 family)
MEAFARFDLAARDAAQWVDDLARRLGWLDREKACVALLAALHGLRDSMPPREAALLGQAMTPLVRGLYFEGWRMARPSAAFTSRDGFLERIRDGVHRDAGIDAEQVARAVLALLAAHLPAAELEDAKAVTPKELRAFWPV